MFIAADTYLYNALNISAITTGLDLYNTAPALFNDNMLPQDFVGSKSINFYSTSFDGRLDFGLHSYVVNCRAKTYGEAMTIAQLVFDNINRRSFISGYYITCSLGAGIAPKDNQDNYNIPVDIILKKGA